LFVLVKVPRAPVKVLFQKSETLVSDFTDMIRYDRKYLIRQSQRTDMQKNDNKPEKRMDNIKIRNRENW